MAASPVVSRVEVHGLASAHPTARRAVDRVLALLAHHEVRATSTGLRFSDVNGPKGGRDARCNITVKVAKRPVTKDEINEAVKAAAKGPFRDILEYTEQPIVSSDVIGNDHSAVFDALSTSVLGGNLVKTITWYDNGWGYARRCVELIERMTEAA